MANISAGTLWLGLVLLGLAPATAAQQPLLGLNYSEIIPTGSLTAVYSVATATDSQGAIYVLETGVTYTQQSQLTSYLLKLAPTGRQVVYQTALTFRATGIAVDPAGNVYMSGSSACGATMCPGMVEKLGSDGTTVMYTTTIALDASVNRIAVDPDGRLYVVGSTTNGDLATTPGVLQPAAQTLYASQEFVVRLTATGTVDYATYYGGSSQAFPVAIAADASGSAFVTGFANTPDFPTTPGAYLTVFGVPNFYGAPYLMRLSPDGSSLVYSTFVDTLASTPAALAVDGADNATIGLKIGPNTSSVLRFNSQGTAKTFSQAFPVALVEGVVVDGSGNSYAALSASPNFPAQNSLAPCGLGGSTALAEIDPDGNVLQATYVAGSEHSQAAVGLGTNSSVYVIAFPDTSYTPTQQLAGSSGGLLLLASLAPSANAVALQLACVGNAASYDNNGISGGEIVSLFGQGLGPITGTQPEMEWFSGFPNQLAGVQVTFNGMPGPLLYAQDAQINAIAPWALPATGNVNICAVYNGVTTNCIVLPALSEHPGVFTTDGTYAAALNQDGSFNSASNPAQYGSTVSIFTTGLGPISPAQPDGSIVGMPLPVDVLPVQVYYLMNSFLDGTLTVDKPVRYAGPAPLAVAGFGQINFVVGQNLGIYGGSPYYLQVGGTLTLGVPIEPGSNGFLVYEVPATGH